MGELTDGTKGADVASEDRFALLWRRVKEHRIAQWTVGYVAIAYGIQHAVTLTSEAFDWPHAVTRVSMLFLALGLPVAMTLAWYHGERATRGIGRGEMAIVSVMLVGISLAFYLFVRPVDVEVRVPAAQEAGVTAARRASLSPAGAISVAVMPFENLSGDKDQEYFSDGMTDELSGALAKIPDLRVVARSSAFQFKGRNQDARAIGQQLHATHLIEGSVRKAGDQLRISAELVKADDGVTIWSSSYDRQLKDVFTVQEDIARAIAASLRMPLGLKPGENLVSDRPADQQTYELYLRGVAAFRLRTRQEVELLEKVVARDPNFAPGWAMLSQARREMGLYYERRGEESKKGPLLDGAEAAARKAIALAPAYAGGYAGLGAVLDWGGSKREEAMDLFQKGLARDPDDPELLNYYASALRGLGYLKQALAVREHLYLVEPLVPLYNRLRAEILAANGMTETAVRQAQSQPCLGCAIFLEPAYAELGRFNEAADLLVKGATRTRSVWEAAAQVMLAKANKSDPPAQLPDIYDERNFVYAYTRTPERMLDWPEKAMKEGDYRPLEFVFWPTPSSVRKTERFKKLMRDAGLVDYWKAHGWPDLCHPVGTDDFACN